MWLLVVASLLQVQTLNADVLVLKNGDRITGDIKRIWDGEITVEPAYSDKFNVDLSAVHRIESNREFEIGLEGGTSIVARLAGADSDGNQLIRAGDETFAIPMTELFELDEPEKGFDWGSNLEFSAALNSGNTHSSNTKLKADVTVKMPGHRHLGEVVFFKEHQSGVTTQDQDRFKYDYNWIFRDPWFLSTQLSFERDPIIELESRVIVSAGIGLDIWDTPRRNLSVQLGAGGQTEEIGMISTDSSVMIWSLRYRQDFFKDNLELYHNHSITTNVSGRTNTSYKTTTGLRYDITDLLFANLSVDFDYESDPVDVAENEDVAVLAGVGLEF